MVLSVPQFPLLYEEGLVREPFCGGEDGTRLGPSGTWPVFSVPSLGHCRATVSVARSQTPGSAPTAFGPRLGDLGQVT